MVSDIIRVSETADGVAADGDSVAPVFSPDGTKIAFLSAGANLVAGDTNGTYDIFVKDLVTGVVTRVSTTASGGQANGASQSAAFSPDGTKIAFSSRASNLVADDNRTSDIFIKDLSTGAVVRISEAKSGARGNGDSFEPEFSPDGTKIAFWSHASNLVAGDTNQTSDIFVKDLTTGTVTRVSTSTSGGQSNGFSFDLAFSPDGTKIAFSSLASNLIADDRNRTGDIFIKDLVTGALTRISTTVSGGETNGHSLWPVFSPDGTKIAFLSGSSNLVTGDADDVLHVFVKDLMTGAVTRVSTAVNGDQANGSSLSPMFSPDGTKIVFSSQATNLVADDTNGLDDVFIKDLVTGVVTRVSAAVNNNQTDSFSASPAFSPDGTLIAFSSASKISADEHFSQSQIFAKSLAAAFAPVASIADVSVNEGNSGTKNAVFTVVLDKASEGATTIKYATAPGTAAAGSDYTSTAGTLTIASGAASGTITVPIRGDTVHESDESFKLILSDPVSAIFGTGITTLTAMGTIMNDDALVVPAAFYGTSVDDLQVNNPASVQYGGEGYDRLIRSDGGFVAYGGGSDDTLQQAGSYFMNAYGGDGNDWLSLDPQAQASYLYGDQGNDIVEGSGNADYIDGGRGADALYGNGGADVIFGSDGDDSNATITAGAGISGSQATVLGGLYGGDGDDYVDGGLGNDRLEGGAGNDRLVGGDGNDTVSGGTGDDYVDGGAGNDSLSGGDGVDTILGGPGRDTAHGGNGADLIYLAGLSGSKAYGDAGDDQVFAGGGGNVELYGGTGNDTIGSQFGSDVLYGEDGDDLLYGFIGNDTLYGGAGTDRLIGGDGNDILYGGSYIDYFIMNEGFTAGQQDKIMDFQDGVDLVGLPTAVQGHMTLVDTSAGAYLSYSFGAGAYGIVFSGATAAQVGDQIYYYG